MGGLVRRRPVGSALAALVLAGCATAGDIKPGTVRDLTDRGWVRTTEGFGFVTRGCDRHELWTIVLETARTLKPEGHVLSYGPLRILSADESAGAIRAEDPRNFWRAGIYVGIFLHEMQPDLTLVEVSAFWDTRTVALDNVWEDALVDALLKRVPCVVSSEEALRAPRQIMPQPLAAPKPVPARGSELFCRQRADKVRGAGSWREAWLAEYQRCMAGN